MSKKTNCCIRGVSYSLKEFKELLEVNKFDLDKYSVENLLDLTPTDKCQAFVDAFFAVKSPQVRRYRRWAAFGREVRYKVLNG